MKKLSEISPREISRIVLCLAVTCFVAGIILGGVYFLTEPVKRRMTKEREIAAVRHLLDLKEDSKLIEVRRYLNEEGTITLSYLVDGVVKIFDTKGNLLKEIPASAAPPAGRAGAVDETRFVGRFFVAWDVAGNLAGYVTEGSQSGFKSNIRFFAALNKDFTLRAVEVISQEEDPGLGAEIIRPEFLRQFAGRSLEPIEQWKVQKGPAPKGGGDSEKIYGVTGATISSQALADGVAQAMRHLRRRIQILFPEGGLNHE